MHLTIQFMKNKLPQTDALQTGLLSVYVASLKPEAEQSRQGAPPDAMLSLLYCNGSQRTLIPLNFDATDPQHIQLSTRENGRLAVTLDSHRHMYFAVRTRSQLCNALLGLNSAKFGAPIRLVAGSAEENGSTSTASARALGA